MAGGVRKLGVGDRVQIAAKDYNRWQDAGMAHAFARFNQNDGRLTPDAQEGIILVKNTTALSLPRFSILGLNGSVYDPNYSEQQRSEFKNQIALKGEMPSSTYAGKFCVLQNDALPGEVVPAMVSGVTPCLLKVGSTSDTYAEVETDADVADRTRYLKTSGSGTAAQILYKPPSVTGEQLGVVRLSNKPSGGAKIVTPKFQLYAAFGGGYNANNNLDYQNADLNSLAISTGNYIALSSGATATARNRVTYPGACYVWEYDSDGILQNTLEEIDCVNLTGLPIMGGTWCIARQVDGIDYWVATKIGEFANASKHFRCAGSSIVIDGTEAKLERGEFVPRPESTSTAEQDWAHVYDGDVFIHHPGTYTVTYGAEVRLVDSSNTTWTDSNGDTLDLPNGLTCEVALIPNWNPTGVVAGDLKSGWAWPEVLTYALPPRTNRGVWTQERTTTINHTLDTWHGQPYLRLNFAINITHYFGSAADNEVGLLRTWLHIRPEGGGQAGGNEGTGYNAFLGTNGAFQWWGGGSAPGDFDDDGVAI